MKRALLLTALLLIPARASLADHIGIFSDASGSSCNLGPSGFSPDAHVIHQFTTGATGSDFQVVLPNGSSFFAFDTAYADDDHGFPGNLSLSYGACLSGSIVLGKLIVLFTPGVVSIVAADGFSSVTVRNCAAEELPASGGIGYVESEGPCVVATESSSWGKVKALYR